MAKVIIDGKENKAIEVVELKTKGEKWVKCIKNANDLTVGKLYLIIDENDTSYQIEDDKETCWQNKMFFKPCKTDLQKFEKFFKRMRYEFVYSHHNNDDYCWEVTKESNHVGYFWFTKDGKFIG